MRRPGPAREIPPPLELECLKVLWSLGEASGKEVLLAVSANRQLAYTTVMTVLDRLARKGGVGRRKVGRSFVYRPLKSREALRRIAVKELLASFFDNSPEALIDYLRQVEPSARVYAESAFEDRLDTALL
ncbi:MAG: BlaI/MecI/CopY family transcriptional regulator [Bryobacteraceae bacterium]